MIRASTLQLLRFHFSFFLMPVYWFALSQVVQVDVGDAILIFIILHIVIYPSSNGYNSYMDRDTEPIGGVNKPMQPTRQLFHVSILLDIIGILLSMLISYYFALGIILYILASRAYSYRGIRLKKFPVVGYLVVIICQGALIFFLVKHGASITKTFSIPVSAMIASSLLIGGFYPLTQVYQHQADKKDGVITLSYLLGYRGTFFFSAFVFIAAMVTMAYYFGNNLELERFFIFQIFLLPVLVYFLWWFYKVWRDSGQANYKNTMRMNIIASLCTNAGFITLLLIEKF